KPGGQPLCGRLFSLLYRQYNIWLLELQVEITSPYALTASLFNDNINSGSRNNEKEAVANAG
ncbi:MAG: hypothetical protein OSJ53_13050, partial [Kineothrix sp.]|nr:hypothetical protein [Kineothrix sp.]